MQVLQIKITVGEGGILVMSADGDVVANGLVQKRTGSFTLHVAPSYAPYAEKVRDAVKMYLGSTHALVGKEVRATLRLQPPPPPPGGPPTNGRHPK